MNKKECSISLIPFDVDSVTAWHSLLKYLTMQNDTPTDIACESRLISSEKIYYPVERLTVNYKSQWEAVSIFKEYWTERETWLEQEIHYFDRFGMEHTKPGFDYFDRETGRWKSGTFNPIKSKIKGYSGSVDARPWNPKEVTVQKSRDVPYEREINRQNTSGNADGSLLKILTDQYPFFRSLYANYNGGERILYSNEAIEGIEVQEAVLLDESGVNQVISKAKSKAKSKCINQIPGQEYTNFQMTFAHVIDREFWYFPAYKIIYVYKNEKFECLVSGCTVDSVYETIHPTDSDLENILQKKNKMKTQLGEKKKKINTDLFMSIVISLLVVFVGSPMLMSIVNSVVNNLFLIMVVNTAIVVGIIYFAYKKIRAKCSELKAVKLEISDVDKMHDDAIQNRQKKKNRIFEIMTDENLTDNEKKEKCESVLI